MSDRKHRGVYTAICFAAYASVYFGRLNFSMATPYFKLGNIFVENQIGTISSIFLIVYALGRVFNGALADKLSPRKILLTGCSLIGISNLSMGLYQNYLFYCFMWAINAYAQSMLWGSIIKTVCFNYETKTKQTKVMSFIGSTLCIGNVMIIGAQSLFVEKIGLSFKSLFIIPGLFALAVALTVLVFFKEQNIPSAGSTGFPSLKLFANPKVYKMAVPAFLHGILKDNLTLWVPLFFAQKYLIDTGKIPLFVLAVPIIGMISRIAYPFLYKLSGNNIVKVSAAAMGVCAVSSFVLTLDSVGPVIAAVMLCFISGTIQVVNNTILAVFPTDFSARGKASEVSGWMDLATYTGAALGSKVYGMIIGKTGFNVMFISWAIISILAIIGFWFFSLED